MAPKNDPLAQGRGNSPFPANGRQKPRGGLIAVIVKELKRVFTDPRMVLTTVLLPGIMIFVIYSVIGQAVGNLSQVDEGYQTKAYAVGLPASFKPFCDQAGLAFEDISADQADGIKEGITNKELDLLVVFPDGFDASMTAALSGSPSGDVPNVQVYFNSTRIESTSAYGKVTGLLDAYKNASLPLFTVNAGNEGFDLATSEDTTGAIVSALLPFLIILLLFTGAQGIASESIAGEKERGTIATLLVTPLKRWELALGKVIGVSVVALASGLSSFIGIMAALPSMLNATGGAGTDISLNYGFADYALLLLVVLSTVLLFVSFIFILSALAKTVKEAATLVMPLMIAVALVGISGMFSQTAQEGLGFYLIPVYNSVQCLVGIFSFSTEPLHVAVAVCTNVLVAGVCVLALTKMFNSERVMFSR